MISNKPNNVQKFFDNNHSMIEKSSHNITILVNFNNIETIPTDLNSYGLNTMYELIPGLIRDGKYYWNESRFRNQELVDYDYIHLVDDDVKFLMDNIDQLYDVVSKELPGFVQVTTHRVKSIDLYDSLDIYKFKHIHNKLVKGTSISSVFKITAGGHMLSRKFVDDHLDELLKFNVFNEDTYRCYVALKYDELYRTKFYTGLSEYNSKSYNSYEKLESLLRFIELGIPVSVGFTNSITPLVTIPDTLDKVDDLVYSEKKSDSKYPSLIIKYLKYLNDSKISYR